MLIPLHQHKRDTSLVDWTPSQYPTLTFSTGGSSNPGSEQTITKPCVSPPKAAGFLYVSLPSLYFRRAALTDPEREQTPHLLKLTFKEAGGGQFYQVVEEMKNRLGVAGSGRGTPMEALRTSLPIPCSLALANKR